MLLGVVLDQHIVNLSNCDINTKQKVSFTTSNSFTHYEIAGDNVEYK